MELTDYKPAELWLDQFSRRTGDRELAGQMLEKFRYVPNVDLASDLAILLEREIPRTECASLYVERELLTTRSKRPVKMYRENKVPRFMGRKKALRATGAARAVVRSLTNNQQQVGSEGVIAQQLTQLCNNHPRRFLLHPSAEQIRARRVRHMVIVTDFVGSGNRIRRMLASLWQVRSVRSWHSGKYIRIWVVCYSGTPIGLSNVRSHPSRPSIVQVLECPTLDSAFDAQHAMALKDLCNRYGEFHDRPLGYGEVGALIAFEHSCPNNAPAVFIEASSSHTAAWQPLFERRSTIKLARATTHTSEHVETLALETLKYPGIAAAPAYRNARRKQRNIILLLAALTRRKRHTSELVSILRMPLWELSDALSEATVLGLVDTHRRLTKVGLKKIHSLQHKGTPVAPPSKNHYHPTVLRAPC